MAADLSERLRATLALESDAQRRLAMERALEATQLLTTLRLGEDVLIACLAAALPEYRRDEERVQAELGGDVAHLVQQLHRVRRIESIGERQIQSAEAESRRVESLRKMVLAMAQDVRVILIELAERVCLMRSLTKAPEATRRQVGRVAMDLYAPLANRLGVWQLKWELEDLAFRFLEPALYKDIASKLDEKRVARESYIAGVIEQLRSELAANAIVAEVAGRPKHIYSIYKKMRKKDLEFEDLYDVRAARVLVEDVKDCYAVLGIVHSLWQPIAGEFDDYISHPKGNYYRSLHTAVVGPQNQALEVQIRTREMDRDAELGIAAHWRYKEGGKSERKYEEKIALLRQLLDWRDDVSSAQGQLAQSHLFEDTIYVLTPGGQILDLPRGATPIDFAYHVHTDLGHRCRGAKVDGNIVSLSYRLQNGQRVEISAAKQGGPSRDWLNAELGFLASTRAMAKVRAWFKQQQAADTVAAGRSVLEKELQRSGATDLNLDKLAQSLKFAHPEALCAAIGHAELTARQLQQAIQELVQPAAPIDADAAPELTKTSRASPNTGGVLVLGVDNLATVIAKCCKPVPPEPIVGFVTKGRGVVVHGRDCQNLRDLDEERQGRLMQADWGRRLSGPFAVDLVVDAVDRSGLLRDISDVMAREHINVTAVNTLSKADRARMNFTVELTDLVKLNQLLMGLRAVRGVIGAARKR
jgi:GTP pyrophosphokinase